MEGDLLFVPLSLSLSLSADAAIIRRKRKEMMNSRRYRLALVQSAYLFLAKIGANDRILHVYDV